MSAVKANLETLPRGLQVALGIGLVALLAFPFFGTDFYTQMVARMMILAIFAMSLDLLQGVTGLVSLGHAAYFGLAGYALAFVTPQDAPASARPKGENSRRRRKKYTSSSTASVK